MKDYNLKRIDEMDKSKTGGLMKLNTNNEEVNLLSKCCGAKMDVDCGDEGTCCYICDHCGKPCDGKVVKSNITAVMTEEIETLYHKICQVVNGCEDRYALHAEIEEVLTRIEKEAYIKGGLKGERRRIISMIRQEAEEDWRENMKEAKKEAYEKGRTESIMALDLDITKNFNKALKDETSELVAMTKEVGAKEARENLIKEIGKIPEDRGLYCAAVKEFLTKERKDK